MTEKTEQRNTNRCSIGRPELLANSPPQAVVIRAVISACKKVGNKHIETERVATALFLFVHNGRKAGASTVVSYQLKTLAAAAAQRPKRPGYSPQSTTQHLHGDRRLQHGRHTSNASTSRRQRGTANKMTQQLSLTRQCLCKRRVSTVLLMLVCSMLSTGTTS